jgi:hypothetical protein
MSRSLTTPLTKGTPIRVETTDHEIHYGLFEQITSELTNNRLCIWSEREDDYLYFPLPRLSTLTIYIQAFTKGGE